MSSRPLIIAFGLAVTGCSSNAPQTMPRAAGSIVLYEGTWRAVTYSRNRDTLIVTWTWIQRRDSFGTLRFGDEPNAGATRIVHASVDSAVFDLLAPLRFEPGNILDGATQRYVARVLGDSITGTAYTTLTDGRRGRRPFAGERVKR